MGGKNAPSILSMTDTADKIQIGKWEKNGNRKN